MNKRLIITGLLVLTLGTSMAFAANNEQQPTMPMGQMMSWDQMKDSHKQMLDQAVKDGRMTTEQVKAMDEHMNSMQNMMKNMGSGMMNPGMMGSSSNAPCSPDQAQVSISQ